jgi:hypothetical protein
MAKTDVVELVFQYQFGSDQHGFCIAIKRVESGMS